MSWYWPFGSAAFGPSNAQKDAEGFPREQGAWNRQQYIDWLARANQAGWNADNWQPWAVNRFQDWGTHGLGTPDDVRNYGNWIMPGRQSVVDSRRGRLDQIGTDFDQTFGGSQNRWNDLGAGIGSNYDITQGDINGTFSRVGDRADSTHRDIVGNIGDTYGSARQGVLDTVTGLRTGAQGTFDDMLAGTAGLYGDLQGRSTGRFDDLGQRTGNAYGDMRSDSGATFGGAAGRAAGVYGGLRSDSEATHGGLRRNNEGAYDTAETTLQRLNPAGDATAARRARSFAPQVALAMGRLRAAGIDPNSPEAASLLGRVETARSRATDDAYGDETRQYVDRANDLTLGREGVNRGLALSGLRNRQDLATTEEGIGRGLALAGLNNRQGLTEREQEIARSLGLGEMENFQRLGTEQGAIDRGLQRDRLGNDQRLAMDRLGMDTNLTLGAGHDFRNELTRNLGTTAGLDLDWLGQTNRNRNNAFAQTWDWTQGANALDQSGFNTRANLGREQNAEDAWRYNFDTMAPWQTGLDWMNNQNRVQQNAAGTVLNAGNAAAGQATSAAQTARGFGNDAANNFQQTWQYESPNAAWLLKMLASAGQAAMTGGMTGGGQNPWAGGYNPGGNGGIGQQNPSVYRWATQNPQMQFYSAPDGAQSMSNRPTTPAAQYGLPQQRSMLGDFTPNGAPGDPYGQYAGAQYGIASPSQPGAPSRPVSLAQPQQPANNGKGPLYSWAGVPDATAYNYQQPRRAPQQQQRPSWAY